MKTIEQIKEIARTEKNTGLLRRKLQQKVNAFNRKNGLETQLHYAYHEDDQFTWADGWSELDYYPDWFNEDEQKIEKIVDVSWLTTKKKPTSNFRKAKTYTAECCVFVFLITDKK